MVAVSRSCHALTKGYDPHWLSDGTRIYFFRDLKDGEQVWSISIDGADEQHHVDVSPMEPISHFFDVSPKGEIVWVRYDQGKSELWLSELPD